MNRALLDELLELPPAERLELVEALWDSIGPEQIPPLTPEQVQALDEEVAAHAQDPTATVPWEEVRRLLRSRAK
jgi:putative addiction module component (TIGR02574 family)